MAAPRHVTKMAANSFATSRMAPQAKRSPGAARRPSPASNPAMSRTPPRRPAAPGRGWPSSITSPGCHTLRQHHGTTPPTSPGYRPSRRAPRGGGAATGAPAPSQAVQRVVRASRIAAQNKLAEQVGGGPEEGHPLRTEIERRVAERVSEPPMLLTRRQEDEGMGLAPAEGVGAQHGRIRSIEAPVCPSASRVRAERHSAEFMAGCRPRARSSTPPR